MESVRKAIIEEAQHLKNTANYSSEGHYEDEKRWTSLRLLLGIPASIFSAVAGASALAQFDNHAVIAGVLAIVVAVLTALATFLNPSERASSHKTSGDAFNALKSNVKVFYSIQASLTDTSGAFTISDQELTERLQDYIKQKDELNKISSPVSEWAYKRAKRNIEVRQN